MGGGSRSSEADVAKGIGIILVVMGHCGGCIPQSAILCSFHMPLFFFLSGLFLFRKEESLHVFVKRKAKSLLLPCLYFGLILSTYSTVLDLFRTNDTLPFGLRYVGLFINTRHAPFPGSLWFFPCLFLIELFMFLFHKITKNESLIALCSIFLAIIGLTVHYYYGKGMPWSLDIALYCTVFTAIGFLMRNIVWRNWPPISYLLVAIVFALSVYANYKYIGQTVDLYTCRLGFYPLFYVSAFTGIFLTLGLAKFVSRNKVLLYYGQNSMIVYSLHYLFLLSLEFLLSMVLPDGLVKNLVHTTLILLFLIPIINIVNRHFKFMTGQS